MQQRNFCSVYILNESLDLLYLESLLGKKCLWMDVLLNSVTTLEQ